LDDDIDTDKGFSVKVQFGIVLRDSAVADISKSEAFESDNDANGSQLLPQTKAIFSNMTVVGPRASSANIGNSLFLAGAQIRRNSSQSIFNSIIIGWPVGILIDASKGYPTDNNLAASLNVQNTIVAGCATPVKYAASTTSPTGATNATILDWFNTASFGNTIVTATTDAKLEAPFNYANPDFSPQAGSPALTGAAFSHSNLLSGFTSVNYRGAVGANDTWYKNWTKFQ
jgi:hypothetical protein